ncbi:MAG TPA: hypothetical protein VMB03_22675 [Bryobacteraceae bacterium]|nr:hypothetical protein [Bryobacteraceae bacterium]
MSGPSVAALALCLASSLAWGQEQDATPSPALPDGQTQLAANIKHKAEKKDEKQTVGSKDRLFFALPNFLTVEKAGQTPPLTAGQKFSVTLRDSFDPVEFAWYGLQAGIGQLNDSDRAFGEGVEGYARRFGSKAGDGIIENVFTRALMPTVFHQDPRYFQLGEGPFIHRLGYALSRIFVTRSDSGSTQFNFSEIVGSAAAAGISSYSYHPEDAHNLSSAVDVWGTQVAYDAVSFAVKEFWPDIRKKIHPAKTGTVAGNSGNE